MEFRALADRMTGRELHWKAGDVEHVVRLEGSSDRGALHWGDRTVQFVVLDLDHVEIDGKLHRFHVYRNRDEVTVWIDGRTYRLTRAQKGQVPDHASTNATGELRALMPGKVLRIEAAQGATVSEKQTLIIMESMKMELSLVAPRAGAVIAVKCQVGQVVEMGELLLVIE